MHAAKQRGDGDPIPRLQGSVTQMFVPAHYTFGQLRIDGSRYFQASKPSTQPLPTLAADLVSRSRKAKWRLRTRKGVYGPPPPGFAPRSTPFPR